MKAWKFQFTELAKLPQFIQVHGKENVLSYVKHQIKGVNWPQVYIKIKGCTTPAHCENLQFASFNLNVGMGTCEWFAVAPEHCKKVQEMCKERSINYLNGSWVPNLEDLFAANIPVIRFTQRRGDMVLVAPGTLHWVRANSKCNNVAYNYGRFSFIQMSMASQRVIENKLSKVTSLIPYTKLVFTLAKVLRKVECEFLFAHVRYEF